ncbi:MAG: DUF3788 family protein [Fimbriimonas sp.]|nr:DUF3788 family protein [Fimbriimonas sp.]
MTSPIYDKSKQPNENDVAEVLGAAYPLWTSLLRSIYDLTSDITQEWTFSGKKYGWSLRLSYKKRAIIRMKPQMGYVSANIIFGEKAYRAALEADLPPDTITKLREAVPYSEGRGVGVEIRKDDEIPLMVQLARIKLDH